MPPTLSGISRAEQRQITFSVNDWISSRTSCIPSGASNVRAGPIVAADGGRTVM
jgi:hypothetical protein